MYFKCHCSQEILQNDCVLSIRWFVVVHLGPNGHCIKFMYPQIIPNMFCSFRCCGLLIESNECIKIKGLRIATILVEYELYSFLRSRVFSSTTSKNVSDFYEKVKSVLVSNSKHAVMHNKTKRFKMF